MSTILQPYTKIIGALAAAATMALVLTGIFICLEIRRKGSTKSISSIPFVGGLVMSITTLNYGFILNDMNVIVVNIYATIVNSCFCVYYFLYSGDKWNDILKQLTVGFGIAGLLLEYGTWEDPSLLQFRYGLILTAMNLLLTAVPLLSLKRIVTMQDASEIPREMTLMGAAVTFLWMLYGMAVGNMFVVVQNLIALFLFISELILIMVYPGPPPLRRVED